ncbi:hypothetical protein [Salimicrobium salexigens]|uniref:Uncharacterized protein n=1 Tax=Salimicrobium salexigens TaxID=908941 RepID=A0ABY1KTD4_9BACI|nr:hypothetical protein [Salimicrobium salexigens]SIS66713.1 hypothetical protein SAMN05421758_103275 [Salimicrobium salexigens]
MESKSLYSAFQQAIEYDNFKEWKQEHKSEDEEQVQREDFHKEYLETLEDKKILELVEKSNDILLFRLEKVDVLAYEEWQDLIYREEKIRYIKKAEKIVVPILVLRSSPLYLTLNFRNCLTYKNLKVLSLDLMMVVDHHQIPRSQRRRRRGLWFRFEDVVDSRCVFIKGRRVCALQFFSFFGKMSEHMF